MVSSANGKVLLPIPYRPYFLKPIVQQIVTNVHKPFSLSGVFNTLIKRVEKDNKAGGLEVSEGILRDKTAGFMK